MKLMMSRCLIICLFGCFLSPTLKGQTNINFEAWSSTFNKLPNEVEVPDQITTSNILFPFAGLGVNKSIIAHSGMHSIVLQSGKIFGNNFTNAIAIGNYKANYIKGYFEMNSGGIPVKSNDIYLDFWSRADSFHVGELYRVELSIRRGSEFVIKDSVFTFSPSTNWIKNSVQVKYNYHEQDSVIIIINSIINNQTARLYIDDITIENTPSSIGETFSGKPSIYPTVISGEGTINIKADLPVDQTEYSIYSSEGQLVYSSKTVINTIYIPVLQSGLFFVRMGKNSFKFISINQ